ncbi:MAG: carboxymuconolactone decarboxylase family protein [Chitinophagales bacterium]
MEAVPRIAPIEHPKSLKLKFFFFAFKKYFGKNITPAKVLYTRVPELLGVSMKFNSIDGSIKDIEPELKLMIKYFIAQENECHFCMDIAQKMAIKNKVGYDKFFETGNFDTSSKFTKREKVALQYAREVNKNKKVSDVVFDQLKQHFNDKQIVEITYMIASENYYNFMNIPLGIESDGLCAIN